VAELPVVVVGAGSSGVAAALSLDERGLRPLIIERADKVASSWRTRYDRLRLNTGRQFSHLPGYRYPRGTPTFPRRDQVVDHIDRHSRGFDIRFNTTLTRIDSRPGGWRLRTTAGDFDTRQVVVATGFDHTPHMPDWPGMHSFTGELMHSSEYRNPARYTDQCVLLVGSGSSGMEIAHDLATGGAAKVWIAVRTPPNIMLRNGPAGLPGDLIATPLYHLPPWIADRIARRARLMAMGDLTEFGLPVPDEGPFARGRRLSVAPALVDMELVDAIRERSIEVVKSPESFNGDVVSLLDGTQLQPDAVICATGYRRGLDAVVGHLDVLDEHGAPRVLAPAAAAEGLRFLGFLARPSMLGYAARQSRRMAKQIVVELSG
jgi:Flavin-binding monooxygenase-like